MKTHRVGVSVALVAMLLTHTAHADVAFSPPDPVSTCLAASGNDIRVRGLVGKIALASDANLTPAMLVSQALATQSDQAAIEDWAVAQVECLKIERPYAYNHLSFRWQALEFEWHEKQLGLLLKLSSRKISFGEYNRLAGALHDAVKSKADKYQDEEYEINMANAKRLRELESSGGVITPPTKADQERKAREDKEDTRLSGVYRAELRRRMGAMNVLLAKLNRPWQN